MSLLQWCSYPSSRDRCTHPPEIFYFLAEIFRRHPVFTQSSFCRFFFLLRHSEYGCCVRCSCLKKLSWVNCWIVAVNFARLIRAAQFCRYCKKAKWRSLVANVAVCRRQRMRLHTWSLFIHATYGSEFASTRNKLGTDILLDAARPITLDVRFAVVDDEIVSCLNRKHLFMERKSLKPKRLGWFCSFCG